MKVYTFILSALLFTLTPLTALPLPLAAEGSSTNNEITFAGAYDDDASPDAWTDPVD